MHGDRIVRYWSFFASAISIDGCHFICCLGLHQKIYVHQTLKKMQTYLLRDFNECVSEFLFQVVSCAYLSAL